MFGRWRRDSDDEEQTRLARKRASMVDHQLRRRGIGDDRVLAAMGSVPRELFVPEGVRQRAYEDSALPIGEGQTISQPFMVARTCELARLQGEERVLEVGAGSGYQAAVLGRLAKRVVGIERMAPLAEGARRALHGAGIDNVQIVVGDGSQGYPAEAPYDVIVVAAATATVPQHLQEQLAPGGRMVLPLGPRFMQRLVVLEKLSEGFARTEYDGCVFVPLVEGDEGEGT